MDISQLNVYLIKASSGSEYSKYKKDTGGPPQNIFSTAAATPSGVSIEMCDETIGMKTNFRSKADIVAIFMSTPDALRAYEIANKFRKLGKTIVLGGLHTKFMQEEALRYADALLIGETEEIWPELLSDFQNGGLKKVYERDEPLNLSLLKPYPTDIIHPRKYNYTWSVVVSRGCPYHCGFCLVPKFFDGYKTRPIQNIVDELKLLKKKHITWVELHSDNLTYDRDYALELFKAIAPLKLNFYGETTVLIAKDRELLEAARNAGLKALLLGIETPSKDALKGQGKGFVKPSKIKEYVSIIKSYGIEIWGDFLFGFDEHDDMIFRETWDFVKEINVDNAIPHMVIPFPGSKLYNNLVGEDRIITKDWSKYDGNHAVFKPNKMEPKELENGLNWFYSQRYGKIGNYLYNTFASDDYSKSKWKTYTVLILLLPVFWYGYINLAFGILFLLWSLQSFQTNHAFLIEDINRHENPGLFWFITIFWLGLSVLSIVYWRW